MSESREGASLTLVCGFCGQLLFLNNDGFMKLCQIMFCLNSVSSLKFLLLSKLEKQSMSLILKMRKIRHREVCTLKGNSWCRILGSSVLTQGVLPTTKLPPSSTCNLKYFQFCFLQECVECFQPQEINTLTCRQLPEII